ncbi:unnamed protein product, partial [Mesorhabditis spiculigera]
MAKFYAVAHGFKSGLFEDWNEAKKQIDDFPQPVYKKFEDKKEAEKYLAERAAKSTEIADSKEDADAWYAVARGKVVGVLTDYAAVKKSIADYPQPLHKKFSNFEEAHHYYLKYAKGKDSGSKEEKQPKKEKETKKPAEEAYYAVARGHKTGVFSTWAECKEQTEGFKGAKFKKFDNKDDAELFAAGKTLKQIEETKKRAGGDVEEEAVEKKRKRN